MLALNLAFCSASAALRARSASSAARTFTATTAAYACAGQAASTQARHVLLQTVPLQLPGTVLTCYQAVNCLTRPCGTPKAFVRPPDRQLPVPPSPHL